MLRVPVTELSPQLRDYTDKLEYSSEFLLKMSAEYAEAFLKTHPDLNTEKKMSDSPSNSEGSKGWVDWNKRHIANAPIEKNILIWAPDYKAWICGMVLGSERRVLITMPDTSEPVLGVKWWLPMFEAPSDH